MDVAADMSFNTWAEFYDVLRAQEAYIAAGADPFDLGVERMDNGELAAHACQADCPHLLRMLLGKYGVDVNFREAQGFTLLSIAAKYNSLECIPVLLTRGASIDLWSRAVHDIEHGAYTPLYYAAEKGHVAACRLLLDGGASVDTRSGSYKSTPLHAAAKRGAVGVIGLLLNRGADPNATCTALTTPIFSACFEREALAVQALLPHAELAHMTSDGLSLLLTAATCGGLGVLKVILPRYVEAGLVDIPTVKPAGVGDEGFGSTPLMLACLTLGDKTGSKLAEVKLLLKAGATRYATDAQNSSPLHYCCYGNDLESLKKLLGKAPPWKYTPEQLNQVGAKGRTPLCWAVRGGSVDICQHLIAAGATPQSSYGDLARELWPDRPALAALFGAQPMPMAPPCCAWCQKSGDGPHLKACSQCHIALYCSNACQRQHWKQHKCTCVAPAAALKEAEKRALENLAGRMRDQWMRDYRQR